MSLLYLYKYFYFILMLFFCLICDNMWIGACYTNSFMWYAVLHAILSNCFMLYDFMFFWGCNIYMLSHVN